MEKLTKALMTDETGQAIVGKLTALSGQMHELAMATRGSAILFESESDISVLGDGGYLAVYVGTTNPLVISGWSGDNSLVTGHLYYLIKSGTAVTSGDLGEYGGTAVTDETLSEQGAPADAKAVGDALAEKADSDDVTALDTRVTAVEGSVGDLSNLQTENKTNLVEAINEAAQTGSSGGGDTVPMNVRQAIYDLFKTALYDSDMPEYSDLQSNLATVLSWIEAVTAINLLPRSIMLNSVGATSQLTATTVPAGGTIVWSSNDESVATVSQTGLVTITGFGSCTITATCGFVSASCSVVASSVTLSSISAVYTPSGKVYTTDTLDSLKPKITVTAHWSDSSTSEVSAGDYVLSGTLTKGTSVITVGYGGKTDTISVTVTGRYTVTNNLTNATTSNNSTAVDDGASYTATLTPGSGFYDIVATVTMGGVDITATAYSNKVVSIPNVTGNIVVTASGASNILYDYPFDGSIASRGKKDLGFATHTPGENPRFLNDGTYTYLAVNSGDNVLVADTPSDFALDGDFTISLYAYAANANENNMVGWAHYVDSSTISTKYDVQPTQDYTPTSRRRTKKVTGLVIKTNGYGLDMSFCNVALTYGVTIDSAPAKAVCWDGNWHHYCLQRDNGIMTMYFDKTAVWTLETSDTLYLHDKLAVGAVWSDVADDDTFKSYNRTAGIRNLIIDDSALDINAL